MLLFAYIIPQYLMKIKQFQIFVVLGFTYVGASSARPIKPSLSRTMRANTVRPYKLYVYIYEKKCRRAKAE